MSLLDDIGGSWGQFADYEDPETKKGLILLYAQSLMDDGETKKLFNLIIRLLKHVDAEEITELMMKWDDLKSIRSRAMEKAEAHMLDSSKEMIRKEERLTFRTIPED